MKRNLISSQYEIHVTALLGSYYLYINLLLILVAGRTANG
jgi:hypothetical protein